MHYADPYVIAHSIALLLDIGVVLYYIASSVRNKLRGTGSIGPNLALLTIFLSYSLMEALLVRYYETFGSPFVINEFNMISDIDVWFHTLASVFLAFSVTITMAFYFLKLEILYPIPILSTISSLYLTYLTYRIVGSEFLFYLS
ncbi:MAG: hypothetical protein QW711_08225, partial [Candidatus Korarchaeum sp.]